jgi:FtsH-binding integral membrane protein
MNRDPFARTDYGLQAVGLAPVIIGLAIAAYTFRSSLWVSLPAAGLGVTIPGLVGCVWLWWRNR